MRQAFIFVILAMGFGLMRVSDGLELQGDLATAPGDRLSYHVTALIALIAAAACFVSAGWKLLRASRKRSIPKQPDLHQVFAEESSFDAEAALARYQERQRANPPAPESPKPPRSGGFGRKGT